MMDKILMVAAILVSLGAMAPGASVPERRPLDFHDEQFYETQGESVRIYTQMLEEFQTESASSDQEVYPDYYGGAYIDQKTGGLVILITEGSDTASDAIAAYAGRKNVTITPCKVSYNELLDAVNRIADKMTYLRDEREILIDGVGPDIINGRVVVFVQDLTQDKIDVIKEISDEDFIEFQNSTGGVIAD